MSVGSAEGLLLEVYKVASERAVRQGVLMQAGHVLAAAREVVPITRSEERTDVALFEHMIKTLCSLQDEQLKTPEIEAVVTALKRWENLTQTSPTTRASVRSVAGKFFPPMPHSS